MKFNITKINSLDFNNNFKDIIDVNHHEFYNKSGKEHYRLLSYFSTLFNNSNIIDIGTHMGYSAVALSYNKSNTIYTFDIIDKVSDNIKSIQNIKFCYDDLFNKDTFYKWKDIILSCPFIFAEGPSLNLFISF